MELQKQLIKDVAFYSDAPHNVHWAPVGLTQGNVATKNQRLVYLGSANFGEALVYACEAFIGTGGGFPWHIEPDPVFELPPTGAAIRIQITGTIAPSRAEAAQAQVRTVGDQVAAIKSSFGLSVSQLADVLNVKRPTIYSWLHAEKGPNALRTANKERLSILCRLAEEWNRRSTTPPGALLNANVVGEASLLNLLSVATLSDVAINKAFDALVERMRGTKEADKSSFGDQMRKKGFAEAPRMRRR